MALLARVRRLRGSPFDPFRFGSDRKLELRHRAEYETDLKRIHAALNGGTFDLCRELAGLPLTVRGFGHVRREAYERAAERRREILKALDARPSGSLAAE